MSDLSFAGMLGERRYISQYGVDTVGVVIHKAGVPTDADGNVTVTMTTLDEVPVVIVPATVADHVAEGTYEFTMTTAATATPGVYRLNWTFNLDSNPEVITTLVEVGEQNAIYDNLTDDMKGLVEKVWVKFADLFDSPFGGPHLQVYFQTRFGRGRMANLLHSALGRLNTIAQPTTTYTLGPEPPVFPLGTWGSLLETALYIEAIKHLIRSYVEQPEAMGVSIARLDRRDYMARWERVLQMEQSDFENQLSVFKIRHMGLGRVRTLVSGGVYGNYAPTRLSHSAAARPRYWARFFT